MAIGRRPASQYRLKPTHVTVASIVHNSRPAANAYLRGHSSHGSQADSLDVTLDLPTIGLQRGECYLGTRGRAQALPAITRSCG